MVLSSHYSPWMDPEETCLRNVHYWCQVSAVQYTANSRKVVGKNVYATIPKGNMGYDQYTVPDPVAVEPTFAAFLYHSHTYVHGLPCHSFTFL